MIIKKLLFKKIIFLVSILVFVSSCGKDQDIIVEGMSPIYVSFTDFTKVKSVEPKSFNTIGNIVNVGDYIFINEKNKGIHVIDNIDPKNPVNIHFWAIPGNTQFTIEETILFADNGIHLLIIDISDFSNIKVLNYIKDVYEDVPLYEVRPPRKFKGYFYCVKREKGILVGWEKKELVNPLCETY